MKKVNIDIITPDYVELWQIIEIINLGLKDYDFILPPQVCGRGKTLSCEGVYKQLKHTDNMACEAFLFTENIELSGYLIN